LFAVGDGRSPGQVLAELVERLDIEQTRVGRGSVNRLGEHSGQRHEAPVASPPSSNMNAAMLRIRKARALDDFTVRLTLTNGDVVERNLGALLWGSLLAPLREDYDKFRDVRVEAGTLAWPGDLDIDPDTLIWGGPAPNDPAARPLGF